MTLRIRYLNTFSITSCIYLDCVAKARSESPYSCVGNCYKCKRLRKDSATLSLRKLYEICFPWLYRIPIQWKSNPLLTFKPYSIYSEEDNDDIIPILERHSKVFRELYGDFYISELISRHPESERILLVCEVRPQNTKRIYIFFLYDKCGNWSVCWFTCYMVQPLKQLSHYRIRIIEFCNTFLFCYLGILF